MTESITTPAAAAAIVAASEDAIVGLTPDGVVTSCNAAATRVYGFAPAELIGSSFDRVVPPELQGAERRRLEHAARGERLPAVDTARIHRDGGRVVVSSSVFPIPDAHGQVTTFGLIERDVTQQRALEAELLQAKRMETVGRLARGAAQEANNINTTILGLVDFVAARIADDPTAWRDLDEIRKQARRGSRLARHILAFASRSPAPAGPADVSDSLRSMESLLRRLVSERVRVELDLVSGPTLVAAETGQLELIVFELVMRACDVLGSRGTITISTRTRSVDADALPAPDGVATGEYVAIAVRAVPGTSDMPASFFTDLASTAGEATSAESLGRRISESTMSLAMVSSVLQRVGGYLLGDRPGEPVTVLLPALPNASKTEPRRRAAMESATEETILLVEDDDSVRDVIARALRSSGFGVLEARDGDDALNAAAGHAAPIHLVISDVVMPNMDGRELYDRLRSWYPNIRFLFMSGYASGAIGTRELRGPVTEFLPKPFTVDSLDAVVRSLLERRDSQ